MLYEEKSQVQSSEIENTHEHVKMVNEMERSASSVAEFVDKLRKLDISKLVQEDQTDYTRIVNDYESILLDLQKYISGEKPKFELLQRAVFDQDIDDYKELCTMIDTQRPKDIYDRILELQTKVRNRRTAIRNSHGEKLWKVVTMGGAGILLIIASVVTAIITLGSLGTVPLVVPIITTGFTFFSGFGGFKILFDIIQGGMENAKLSIIDRNLVELEQHLKLVEKNTADLTESNGKFVMDVARNKFKVDDHDHDEIVDLYLAEKSRKVEKQCHLCHIKIICIRLEKMQCIIRNVV